MFVFGIKFAQRDAYFLQMTEIVAPSLTGDELAPPRLHEFPHSSDRVPPGRISRARRWPSPACATLKQSLWRLGLSGDDRLDSRSSQGNNTALRGCTLRELRAGLRRSRPARARGSTRRSWLASSLGPSLGRKLSLRLHLRLPLGSKA